eukprot:2392632-Lingulodinium_polyedra.AAC.1
METVRGLPCRRTATTRTWRWLPRLPSLPVAVAAAAGATSHPSLRVRYCARSVASATRSTGLPTAPHAPRTSMLAARMPRGMAGKTSSRTGLSGTILSHA